MRIALYSPYLSEHTGGGERYMLSVAKCLEDNFDVDLVTGGPDAKIPEIRRRLEEALDIKLNQARFIAGPFGKLGSFWDRWRFSLNYDLFYYLTDGSFFVSGAKFNIVHIQTPIPNPLRSLKAKIKFRPWRVRVANSEFTKKYIEDQWGIKVQYVHSGRVANFKPGKKEKMILSVGRFFTGLHSKKHAVLIEAFKQLTEIGFSDWKLVLVGSLDPGQDNAQYLQRLREQAKGLPVEFAVGVPFAQLQQFYARAMIYWHAAGFNEDEIAHPERFEHFGLSTVEAMASGCVPVVLHKGGQKEIVKDQVNGLGWNTSEELVQLTQHLIASESRWKEISQRAILDSRNYDDEHWSSTLSRIIKETLNEA